MFFPERWPVFGLLTDERGGKPRLLFLKCAQGVLLGPLIKFGGALAQAFGSLGVLRFDLFGIEGDKGIGVLRIAGTNGGGQPLMSRILAQYRFGKFEVKGTGFSGQFYIVFGALGLCRQFVSNATDDQLSRCATGQCHDDERACRQQHAAPK